MLGDLKALLESRLAFPAVFLACDWPEAALALHNGEFASKQMPDYVAVGLTQAYRSNRGPNAALDYALKHKDPMSPVLDMLVAEIQLSVDEHAEALERCQRYTNNPTYGTNATFFMASAYLHLGRLDEAARILRSFPGLARTVAGQEMAGWIAFKQGRLDEATRQFSIVRDQSWLAKHFFANEAYRQGNLESAEQLVRELLVFYPGSPLFQADLVTILNKKKSSVVSRK
jgi:tetratricopeptide (TPR) repeat protein